VIFKNKLLCRCSILFLTFVVSLGVSGDVIAASIGVEHVQLKREYNEEKNSTENSTNNAVILRFGGQKRTSFLKVIELKYADENLIDVDSQDQLSFQQASISTSTSRGSISEGLTIFGLGISGLNYEVMNKTALEYLGYRLFVGKVEPLISTRLFAKGSIDFDYFNVNANKDDAQRNSLIQIIKVEAGLVYSYPKIDLGLSYIYRRIDIDDISSDIEIDVGHGLMGTVRVRFGG